jgi:hypothetical protein
MKIKNLNFFKVTSCSLFFPVFIGSALFESCKKEDPATDSSIETQARYTITQTVSDEAQTNTMAFDALGFMTGCLGSQTFLPPGKVADYSGFQYLRDNDPTDLGHNTSFVTIIAFNILNILNTSQIQIFVNGANDQISMINEYAYMRFPLCKAFRRLIDGDLPSGTTTLNEDSVKAYSARLYKIDGEISYNRAKIFGQIISSLSSAQKATLDALKGKNGVGNWNAGLANPLDGMQLQQDVNVAVMTYASEFYAWYAGSVEADVYFCPERQGTYFGSFYLKDWPAMGNPDYSIDEQLTANAGQNFYKILNSGQLDTMKNIINLQRSSLTSIVNTRQQVSIELRKFMSGAVADSSVIQNLSLTYGSYDGEIIYLYAKYFSEVYRSMTSDQKTQLLLLSNDLGYVSPSGAFLYSQPIAMPEIENTDFMFK